MPNLRDALRAAAHRLDHFDAEVLLMHALGKSRSWLIAHGDDPLAPKDMARFAALVERREAGEPVAYITGHRGFWTLELEVTPATLIPRPETELLVELALERLPPHTAARVLDLGTGSGAIALAIARERPRAEVVAVDTSVDALAVAQHNAEKHGIANVRFLHGDWYSPIRGERFELIVSNPPYIERDDPHLRHGDLRFEPMSALASGDDGFDDIRRIIRGASAHLAPGGWLLFEHGWRQGEAARTLMRNAAFQDVVTARDLEQRDRVTAGRIAQQ